MEGGRMEGDAPTPTVATEINPGSETHLLPLPPSPDRAAMDPNISCIPEGQILAAYIRNQQPGAPKDSKALPLNASGDYGKSKESGKQERGWG